jgi:tetratricopeptide (TPR) repeat protein
MKKIAFFSFFVLVAISNFCQTNYYQLISDGKKLQKEQKIKEAIEKFKAAETLKPKEDEAIYWIGWCYNDLKEYANAIAALKKAPIPFSKRINNELGYAYKKLQLFNDAIEHFEKALLIDPDNYSTNNQLGGIYKEKNNYDKAIEYYKKCEAIANEEYKNLIRGEYKIEPIENLIYCYNASEKFNDAITIGEKGVSLKKTVFLFAELGFAFYKLKQNDKSIEAYKNALLIEPKYATAYKGIGDVYRRNFSPAKITEAMESYKKAIEYNPNSAGSNFGLGWCYNEQSKYADAITYLNKALTLDSKMVAGYTELGYAQYMQSLNNEAINTFKQGIALDNKNKLCKYYLGLVYVKIKDKANAQKLANELYTLDQPLSIKLKAKADVL